MKRNICLLALLAVLGTTPGYSFAQDPEDGTSEESRGDPSEVDLSDVDTSVDLDVDTPYGLDDLRERYKKAAGVPLDNIALGIGLYEAVRDLHDSYAALDERLDIELSPVNTPRVPSSCAGSDDCGACYEQAQRNLNQVRVTLERNRVIGVQTKAMKDDAMAVGQSFASFPGMGIGWYAARRDIDAGWQTFVNTYYKKYESLLGSLAEALQSIGECEATYFDQPDWYDRYGFIYHQFVADSYHPRNVLE